jgi:hypothetical protein
VKIIATLCSHTLPLRSLLPKYCIYQKSYLKVSSLIFTTKLILVLSKLFKISKIGNVCGISYHLNSTQIYLLFHLFCLLTKCMFLALIPFLVFLPCF